MDIVYYRGVSGVDNAIDIAIDHSAVVGMYYTVDIVIVDVGVAAGWQYYITAAGQIDCVVASGQHLSLTVVACGVSIEGISGIVGEGGVVGIGGVCRIGGSICPRTY